MSDYKDIVATDGNLRAVIVSDDVDRTNPRQDYDHLGVFWAAPEARRHSDITDACSTHRWGGHKYVPGKGCTCSDAYNDLDRWWNDLEYDGDRSVQAIVKHIVRKHGATVVIPVSYHSHSGDWITWGSNLVEAQTGPAFHRHWDGGDYGFIFDTAAKRGEWLTHPTTAAKIEECLKGELRELYQYMTGDVWGIRVERRTINRGHRFVKDGDCRVCDRTPAQILDQDDPVDCITDDWDQIDDSASWGYYGSDYAKQEAISLMNSYKEEQ